MIELIVFGDPGPQGSKRHVGRGIMVESSAKVKPWREAVKAAFLRSGLPSTPGPVRMEMVFTMRKPASAPKRRTSWPSTRPDISKLARSTEDALTDVGAYDDDARIVGYDRLYKVFPGEDVDALHVPGVRIRIRSMETAS